jgi:hypothetical protein
MDKISNQAIIDIIEVRGQYRTGVFKGARNLPFEIVAILKHDPEEKGFRNLFF